MVMSGHNKPMIRKHITLELSQLTFLSELPGTVSEHVRRAIDEYIAKIKIEASTSPSKGGRENG
jgi:hypothetical protein